MTFVLFNETFEEIEEVLDQIMSVRRIFVHLNWFFHL